MKTTLRIIRTLATATALALGAHEGRADKIAAEFHPDQVPKLINSVEPEYPFSLRLSGNKGEVVLDFYVDPQGSVSEVTVVSSSHPDFEAPAVEAVLEWKFKPGIKNGHPVYVHMQVPIFFLLLGRGGPGIDPWQVPERGSKEAPAEFQYDEAPKPILTSAPVYPFELLTQNVKGKASVTFAIDTQGQPHVLKVLSATQPEFGAATTAMIESWKFEPAKKDGKPCWALLRKDQVFERFARDFPMNESAERLLKALKKTPSPILADIRDLDSPLKGRFRPSPYVPLVGKDARAEALVEFIVDHAGHAQLPRVLSATTPEFGWAAATAVARWQYTIPSKNGKPVDVFARVPLVYTPRNPPAKGS